MKRTPCEHWIAVADARALGRAVLHDDMARANRHEASCSACAGEADVWRTLSKISVGPPAPSGVRLGRSMPPPRRVSNRPEDDTPFDSIMRAVPVRAQSAPRFAMRGRHAGAALSIAAGMVVAAVLVRDFDDRQRSPATAVHAERAERVSDSPIVAPGPGGSAVPPDAPSASAVPPDAPSASAASAASPGSAEALPAGQKAAALYRAVYAGGPRTPEGRAALVSLGELLLSDLGDPNGALAAFDEYLSRRGGDLTRRAAYGRIRALRALGRDADERAAAHVFLARYRSGADADLVRSALRSTR
jgi:hypothetical protein